MNQLVEIRTFGPGGIHPATHKRLTSELPIEPLPTPAEVVLPLSQHIGEPAVPIVKKGDRVVRGQKIADGGATGVSIHATIAGKVKPIDKRPHPTLVMAESIAIKAEGEQEELPFPEDLEWRWITKEEALNRIREAGIVGLGGAAFPTYRKLMPPPQAKLDTFILNGAECEPYLTSDYRLMLAEPEAIVEGALAMARLIGVKRVLVGVEADKMEAAHALRRTSVQVPWGECTFEVVPCEVRYPQGAERQLVTALTGRVVPLKALATSVGVLVQNVATAHAVYHALRFRKPLLDRVVTVTGPGIVRPRNVRVPIGTSLQAVVDFCGGMLPETTRIIAGGPMMGRALPRLDLPLIKGMNGLLMLTGRGPFEDGYGPCVSCARCIEACPLGLQPDQVSLRVEAGHTLETGPFGARECYECGCCTYVCPSGRPLLQFMQMAKSALRRATEVIGKA